MNFPDRTTPWTGLEGYQRGARMDEMAALAPLMASGGGGGGGGGGGMLPVGDPGWNFGAVATGSAPVSSGNYFGSGGGGVPLRKKKPPTGYFYDTAGNQQFYG
jgi:hypothetical protein